MHRFKLRRRRRPPQLKNVFLMTTILFIFLIFFSLWIIDKGIRPPLMNIAELKTVEFATRTINSAVKSTERITFDDLVDIQTDENGNISTLGWNSAAEIGRAHV